MEKTRKNNLYTASYFKKRMRECGINVDIIIPRYSKTDKRYWTMLIDTELKVHCTCFRYMDNNNKLICYFRFTDGGQYIKFDKVFETQSMNTLTEYVISLKDLKKKDSDLQTAELALSSTQVTNP